MLNYQKKYLKYKTKYLELKNQIGSGECSFVFHNQENAIKAYMCHEYPKDIDKKREFKITDLKKFNIIHLRFANLTEEWIKNNKFKEINNGFSAKELKEAGFSAKDLKNYDNDIIASKYKAFASKLEFTPIELKESGFSAKELKEAGFDARKLKYFPSKQLKDLGFSAIELKDARFQAVDLKGLFTNEKLKEAGFSAVDLKTFVSKLDLVKLGYGVMDLISVLIDEKRYLGFEDKGSGLRKPLLELFSEEEIQKASEELKKAGFTKIIKE